MRLLRSMLFVLTFLAVIVGMVIGTMIGLTFLLPWLLPGVDPAGSLTAAAVLTLTLVLVSHRLLDAVREHQDRVELANDITIVREPFLQRRRKERQR